MIVREREIKNKIKAKGVLVKIDGDGLHIEDEKTEIVDVLTFEDIETFLNKSITFNMADAVKEDMSE